MRETTFEGNYAFSAMRENYTFPSSDEEGCLAREAGWWKTRAKQNAFGSNACEAKRISKQRVRSKKHLEATGTKQNASRSRHCHCKNDSAPARALEILNRETALRILGPTGSTRARS